MSVVSFIAGTVKTWRFADLVVGLLLGASLCTSMVLMIRMSRLESVLTARRTNTELQPGDRVPPLTGVLVDGTPTTLRFSDVSVPTVLYVFTPQCVWCKRNLENITRVVEAAKGRFRVVGVSLTSHQLKEYVAANRFQFPVIHEIGPNMPADYRLGYTPQTIVVSSESRVLKSWVGAYTGDVRRDVEDFFGVTLATIVETPKQSRANKASQE